MISILLLASENTVALYNCDEDVRNMDGSLLYYIESNNEMDYLRLTFCGLLCGLPISHFNLCVPYNNGSSNHLLFYAIVLTRLAYH